MKEKYLPIGTVVTLKNAKKRIMIIGYCPVDNENKQMYDYSACIYPEGLIDSNKILLFNHNQIDQISFEGLQDDEQKENNEQLKKLVSNMQNIKEVKLPDSTDNNTQIETLSV